jgi:hypothetical protein
MQSRTTGHQQLQVWASRQQFLQVGSHRQHLLDVVQQQLLLPGAQGFLQLLPQRSSSTLSDVKDLGDGRYHQCGIANGSKRHEADTIGKLVTHLRGHLQAQARLADTARAQQREQTHLGTGKLGAHRRDFLLTPQQRREQDRQGRMRRVQGRERREIGGQTRNDELKELFGTSDVLEVMLSDIPQAHAIWEVMLHQIAGRLGEQHLSAVPDTHDPFASLEIQANVPLGGKLWLPGVQAHAHPDLHAFRPDMGEEETLRIDGGFDGIGGACKGHKKSLSRRIDLVTVPLLACRTHQVPHSSSTSVERSPRCCSRRVDPSMSAKSSVTVPSGSSKGAPVDDCSGV